MKECLSCQNRCGDCTHCFRKLHDELAAALAEAERLKHECEAREEEQERIAGILHQEAQRRAAAEAEVERLKKTVAEFQATNYTLHQAALHANAGLMPLIDAARRERDDALDEMERRKAQDRHMIDALGEMTERCYKAEEEVERLQSEGERLTLLAELNGAASGRWHELAIQLKRIINKPPVYGYVAAYERENLAALEAKHEAERKVENERLNEWARKGKVNAE